MEFLKYFALLLWLLVRGFVAVSIGLLLLQIYMAVTRSQAFVWQWDLLAVLFTIFCVLALPIAYLYEVSNELTCLKSLLLGGLAGMAYPSVFVLIAMTEEPSVRKLLAVAPILGFGLLPGLVAGSIFWITGRPLKQLRSRPRHEGRFSTRS